MSLKRFFRGDDVPVVEEKPKKPPFFEDVTIQKISCVEDYRVITIAYCKGDLHIFLSERGSRWFDLTKMEEVSSSWTLHDCLGNAYTNHRILSDLGRSECFTVTFDKEDINNALDGELDKVLKKHSLGEYNVDTNQPDGSQTGEPD